MATAEEHTTTAIARRLQLEHLTELERIFEEEGGPRRMLSFHRFIAVVGRLLPPEHHVPPREHEQALRRWAVSFSVAHTPPTAAPAAPAKRRGRTGSVIRAPVTPSDPGAALAVRWSHLTAHIIAHGGDSATAERATAYRAAPASVPLDATAPLEAAPPTATPLHAQHTEKRHVVPPSVHCVSEAHEALLTGGQDGVVKQWSVDTGRFERNLYNTGGAWVAGVSLLDPHEDHAAVATTANRIAVVSMKSGHVLREFIGASSRLAAVDSVEVNPVVHTGRFGLRPGEVGAKRTVFDPDARQQPLSEPKRSVATTVLLGMEKLSAFRHLSPGGLSAYGSSTGDVGLFDIASDVARYAASITSTLHHDVELTARFRGQHAGQVTALRYAKRHSLLISGGIDGRIHRRNVETQQLVTREEVPAFKAVTAMDWCDTQQLLCSTGPDRTVRLWSLLRRDPMHSLNVGFDVLDVTLEPRREHLVVLGADRSLSFYDLRTFRLLQTLEHCGLPNPARGGTSGHDTHGIVTYDAPREAIVCVLKHPVLLSERTHARPSPPRPSPRASPAHARVSPEVSPRRGAKPPPPGVSAMLLNPTTQALFSFNRDSVTAHDAGTGECLLTVATEREMVAAGRPRSTPACAAWADEHHTDLLTVTQAGDLVAWNGLTGHAEFAVRPQTWMGAAPPASGEFTCMVAHSQYIAVAHGPVVHFLPPVKRVDTPGGLTAPTLPPLPPLKSRDPATAPYRAGSNVTCMCSMKALGVAMGTLSGHLHLFNLTTRGAYAASLVRPGDPAASVEAVCWSNTSQRSIVFCAMTTGNVVAYWAKQRVVLFTCSVFDAPREAQLFTAALSPYEDMLFCGDSAGRVHVLDVATAHKLQEHNRRSSATAATLPPVPGAAPPVTPQRRSSGHGAFGASPLAPRAPGSPFSPDAAPPEEAKAPTPPPAGILRGRAPRMKWQARRHRPSVSASPPQPQHQAPPSVEAPRPMLQRQSTAPALGTSASHVVTFQAVGDAVSSLVALAEPNGAFAAGSLDGSVRLHCVSGGAVRHVGCCVPDGRSLWDLHDGATFADALLDAVPPPPPTDEALFLEPHSAPDERSGEAFGAAPHWVLTTAEAQRTATFGRRGTLDRAPAPDPRGAFFMTEGPAVTPDHPDRGPSPAPPPALPSRVVPPLAALQRLALKLDTVHGDGSPSGSYSARVAASSVSPDRGPGAGPATARERSTSDRLADFHRRREQRRAAKDPMAGRVSTGLAVIPVVPIHPAPPRTSRF